MTPILWLVGYQTVTTEQESAATLLDLCFREGLTVVDPTFDDEGRLRFSCTLPTARHLHRLCQERGLGFSCVRRGGLPLFFYRLRRRIGLWLGLAAAMILLILSQQFVWSVDVTGNVEMTVSEVLGELKACGFGVGSYIPGTRMGELETRVLIASERISWISVHMDGTVAVVQIIEHVPTPEETTKPANLIAAADGQIELIELYRGSCAVKIGQAVRRGDLLAGGVYDSSTVGMRFTRAAGKVLARTAHDFSVEIPLTYEKKVYTRRKVDTVVLNFFGISVKIFKNTGNEAIDCDIIKREFGAPSIGERTVPVGITVSYRLEYVTETCTRTSEDAEMLAYTELEHRMATLSEGAELLSKEITAVLTESALVLDCSVVCIEDIAMQAEFEFSEVP